MLTFFVVRTSGSMTVVDSFSRHRDIGCGRMWFPVSKSSLNRLRRLYKERPGAVYVLKGKFSTSRKEAIRAMVETRFAHQMVLSFNHLQTSGPNHENL